MREFYLIHKELESLGEMLEDERLNRRSDIDRLKIELEAVKQALNACLPGFSESFTRYQDELRLRYDPEAS